MKDKHTEIKVQKVDKNGKPIGKPKHIKRYGFPAGASQRRM